MDIKQIVLALFTALGAYGGFPNPPKWWTKLTKFLIVRIICLWALIYQGGGNADITLTTITTIVIFGLFNLPTILLGTAKAVGSAASIVASTTSSAASSVASAATTAAATTEDD
jgi:hypothetical protein